MAEQETVGSLNLNFSFWPELGWSWLTPLILNNLSALFLLAATH